MGGVADSRHPDRQPWQDFLGRKNRFEKFLKMEHFSIAWEGTMNETLATILFLYGTLMTWQKELTA